MGKVVPYRRRPSTPRKPRRGLDVLLVLVIVGALAYSGWMLMGRPTDLSAMPLLASSGNDGLYVPNLRKCYDRERNTSTKTCVVDGDTLWLHGTDYRLRDYDTPEPQSDICGGAAEVTLAHKASARFLELLNTNHWTIETYGPDETGRRILATIRINGRDVGDILIAEHLARRWPDGDEWWCR